MLVPSARRSLRGYSLIELMAALAVVGILAALAIMGYRKWLASARTGETKDLMLTIVQGQHMYKLDTGGYLNCSSAWGGSEWYPMPPNDKKHLFHDPGHAEYDCWKLIAPNSTEPMYVSFNTRAGAAGDTPPQPPTSQTVTYPATTEPWFLVLAGADQDGDTKMAYWFTTSFTPNDIWSEDEDE